jgi:hypothetical protein
MFEMRVSRIPLWERDGDRFRFYCDSQIQLMAPVEGASTYIVETMLVVEGEAPPDGFPAADSWRVLRLDLIRGRTGGQGRPMPGPRAPAGPRPAAR